ncbi:MAG: hypothetical protein ACQ9MH_24105 [Nitrospinales bacterium]
MRYVASPHAKAGYSETLREFKGLSASGGIRVPFLTLRASDFWGFVLQATTPQVDRASRRGAGFCNFGQQRVVRL